MLCDVFKPITKNIDIGSNLNIVFRSLETNEDDNEIEFDLCNREDSELSTQTTSQSTSSFSTHSDNTEQVIVQPKITSMFFSPSVTAKRQEEITDSLVKCIAKDMLPLSTVNGVGFLELMNKMAPNYEVPSRFTIKRRLEGLYQTERYKVAKKIQSIESIALTTDCWTSKSNESYISVTAHGINEDWKIVNYILTTEVMDDRHTSINLKEKLIGIMKDWQVYDKTICIVHDNALNIKNAVVSMAPDIKSRTCFAHSLQLCINKGLEENSIKQILATAS